MENVIQHLMDQIGIKSPLQIRNVQKYVDEMWPVERENFQRRIQYLLHEGETYETIADGYLQFCLYFMEERKYFMRMGTYRHSTFDEIAYLYNDEKYMKNYMLGLSLAIYLWKIQRDNMRFFRGKCQADKHQGGKYLEVGPGHGEYLVTAVENMSFDNYVAVDISKTAVNMTKSYLDFALKEKQDKLKRVCVENKDFLDFSQKEKFDAIVVSEVIEHVENPKKFLIQIRKLAKEDTYIYVSTAINSPFPDHLYHFHNKGEVYSLIEEAGLKVVDEMFSSADGVEMEKAVKKNYDITVGFILTI